MILFHHVENFREQWESLSIPNWMNFWGILLLMFLYTGAIFDREIVSTWWDLLCNLTLRTFRGASVEKKTPCCMVHGFLNSQDLLKIWDPKVYWNFWSMALGTWNIWELNVGPETQTGNFTWSLRFLKQDNQIKSLWCGLHRLQMPSLAGILHPL